MAPPTLAATKKSHRADNHAAAPRNAAKTSYLSDTLTICTDDPQRPIQFSIYGYIIITSTSHVLNSLFKDQKARAHKDVILALLEELISREVFVKEVTFSGRSRKEVEDACYNFVQGMQIERVK